METVRWKFLCALCIALCVGLASSSVVRICKDRGCKSWRLVAQNEQEIGSYLRNDRSVVELDLHGDFLQSFPGNALRDLNSLKMLNLSYNFIDEIRFETPYNSQLETIDLTYNNLHRVTVPSSVKYFYAMRNKLGSIAFQSNSQIQELILSMNHLDRLSDIPSQRGLVHLDVSCNRIREVNFNDFRTSSLQYLNLANNHIHEVSGTGNFPQLRHLSLANNILTILDDSLYINSLNELYLQNNNIVMNTQTNKKYKNLKTFDIRGNEWQCKKVEETINSNKQTTFPKDEKECQNKERICCSDLTYADHLIKHRKLEWESLRNGTTLRKTSTDCNDYIPNPCDGDDGMVVRVAQNSLRDMEFSAADQQKIREAELMQKQANLHHLEEENKHKQEKLEETQSLLQNLESYIDQEYQAVNLTQSRLPAVQKIKAIFDRYDQQETEIKKVINDVERTNQDKTDGNSRLEDEISELTRSGEILQGQVQTTNGTLIALNKEIEKLEAKLRDKGLI